MNAGDLIRPRYYDIMYCRIDEGLLREVRTLECNHVLVFLGKLTDVGGTPGFVFMFPWGEVGWVAAGEVLSL